MKVEIKEGRVGQSAIRELVITIPMNSTPIKSATGKTLSVASSRGNKPTEVQVDGQALIVGVNAYIYANKR